MKDEHSRTCTLEELQQRKADPDWTRFDGMTEAELDDAAADEERAFGFSSDSYRKAVVVLPRETKDVEKERVTIRIDRDVLAYFRGAGKGYQTRINDALRLFIQNIGR